MDQTKPGSFNPEPNPYDVNYCTWGIAWQVQPFCSVRLRMLDIPKFDDCLNNLLR